MYLSLTLEQSHAPVNLILWSSSQQYRKSITLTALHPRQLLTQKTNKVLGHRLKELLAINSKSNQWLHSVVTANSVAEALNYIDLDICLFYFGIAIIAM